VEVIKGLLQVTGVYKDGEIFLDNQRCPFQAQLGPKVNSAPTIQITLVVPAANVSSVLAGLAAGGDLTLDNVPSLLEQS
jgi:hypothetical protein